MQPCARVGADTGERLGHRRVAGVMRETQVSAACVNIDPGAENRQGHGRAFRVPPRTAPSPRQLPRRMAGLADLPDRHVQRVILSGVVRPPPYSADRRNAVPRSSLDLRTAGSPRKYTLPWRA